VLSVVGSDGAISNAVLDAAFAINRAKKVAQDQWALAYINLLHLQPLLEVGIPFYYYSTAN
jgi:hypothetical protein